MVQIRPTMELVGFGSGFHNCRFRESGTDTTRAARHAQRGGLGSSIKHGRPAFGLTNAVRTVASFGTRNLDAGAVPDQATLLGSTSAQK